MTSSVFSGIPIILDSLIIRCSQRGSETFKNSSHSQSFQSNNSNNNNKSSLSTASKLLQSSEFTLEILDKETFQSLLLRNQACVIALKEADIRIPGLSLSRNESLLTRSRSQIRKSNLEFRRNFRTRRSLETADTNNVLISKLRKTTPKLEAVAQKEKLRQLVEGMVKSEKSAAKNAFQYGVLYANNLNLNQRPHSKSRLAAIVEKGNTVFILARKLVWLSLSVAFVGFFFFLYPKLVAQMGSNGGSGGALDSRKANYLKSSKSANNFKPVRFADIVGCDEAKNELEDIVFYLKKPAQLAALGGRVPKGVLLLGPPGVGKTMMARAVATEAGVPFFYQAGSAFDEIFVGVGASRVKELFEKARKNAPCVIFIDEIDAVGGSRSSRGSGTRQTINQLLAEMDGFKPNNGIIVIGATNLGQVLDPALTRSGRFDSKLVISLPDAVGRAKLLEHYLKKVKVTEKIDVNKLGNNLRGYSGAAIENLVNQATLRAANVDAQGVTMEHLDWARVKIELGREKKGGHKDEKELKNTAYHEAAHTLVAHYLKVPYYGVTIERRSNTLGHLRFDINEDFKNRDLVLSRIAVALAGKMGEETTEGANKHTTGCSSDYQMARKEAMDYVTWYAFTDRFIPGNVNNWKVSEKYQVLIDNEVKGVLNSAEQMAKDVLNKHSSKHEELTLKLLEKGKLTAAEIQAILGPVDS